MRTQDDEQLRGWAHQITSQLSGRGSQAAYLIWHGSPGTSGVSTAHAEDTQNGHVLELEDVTVDDLIRLREFLKESGIADVTVKQANAGGAGSKSVQVSPRQGDGH